MADAGSGGWLGGCCWFLEEEWDGRAGQFEDAALDGCADGEFLGSRPVEADGLAGEGGKAAGQVAVVATGSWPRLCLVVSLAFARAERCAETAR